MKSVADALRVEAARKTRALTPSQRVDLALELGEEGLRVYCSAQNLTRQQGLDRLRLQRQRGRRAWVAERRSPA